MSYKSQPESQWSIRHVVLGFNMYSHATGCLRGSEISQATISS